MKTIYKYTIYGTGIHTISLPYEAKILSAGWQNGDVVIWAEVNTNISPTNRTVCVYGTGWDISDYERKFIGTVQEPSGFVWHVFEEFP